MSTNCFVQVGKQACWRSYLSPRREGRANVDGSWTGVGEEAGTGGVVLFALGTSQDWQKTSDRGGT